MTQPDTTVNGHSSTFGGQPAGIVCSASKVAVICMTNFLLSLMLNGALFNSNADGSGVKRHTCKEVE